MSTTKQQPIEEPLVRLLQEWLEGCCSYGEQFRRLSCRLYRGIQLCCGHDSEAQETFQNRKYESSLKNRHKLCFCPV
jgi:hypothetical protein